MIRLSQLVAVAFIALVPCLGLTACFGETGPTRELIAPGDLTTWLGEFDGTADVEVYATGNAYDEAPGNITIERVSSEIATVRIWVGVSPRPVDLAAIGDTTGGPFGPAGVGWQLEAPVESVALNSILSLTQQIGDRRSRLSLTRSADRITGLLFVDSQNGDGTYDVAGRIEVDVTRER
jgi:hypothetical protein